MAERIDGWTLMGRIAANPAEFGACDTTVGLASLLVLRNQLVQGVNSEAALARLADVVGQAPMVEVVENLAGYEAVRVMANIDGVEPGAERRTAEAARRRLLEIVRGGPAPETEAAAPAGKSASARALRRHSAMGARRIRPPRGADLSAG